jgi:hypothetical protein
MRETGYGKRSGGEVVADRERRRREVVLGRSVHSSVSFRFFETAARGEASRVEEEAVL